MQDLKKQRVYLGIDVGGSGAVCLMSEDSKIIDITLNKETDADVAHAIWQAKEMYDVVHCMIENVHSMPKQGVSSSFKFGESKGFLRGLLVAYKIPFTFVTPQRWMKESGIILDSSRTKTEKKNMLKQRAQQLYPEHKITLANADAILLARYCRNTTYGTRAI